MGVSAVAAAARRLKTAIRKVRLEESIAFSRCDVAAHLNPPRCVFDAASGEKAAEKRAVSFETAHFRYPL
jgi:hypothetical protein